ncbi:uncharacterized protein LOC123312414 [Coccinella septempunctata]|uniref:uncharacterized protein LOC123312414 n=1 Tax=Coccinella septempunctata TaxID=41139 RepID=UPI001D06D9E0|nr:uncharacterized protein LOC123312414 [Coccinella septempunctata]
MKLFFLFVLIIGVSADVSAEHHASNLQGFPNLGSGIADMINGIIKSLLDSLKSAIPEPVNLPKLNISLSYDNIANGSFVIGDLVEIGARNFNASVVKANILKSTLNVVLDFPSINLNTNYFSDLLFGSILPMYGEGPANIRLKNLRLNLTSHYDFKLLKMKLQIKNTTLLLTLDDAVFDIHGMINNEAFSILCSQILDDTVSVFINKHNVLISKVLSPVIESVVNSALSGGGSKKVSETLTFEEVPEMDENKVEELRKMFFEELKKQPRIAKFLSF